MVLVPLGSSQLPKGQTCYKNPVNVLSEHNGKERGSGGGGASDLVKDQGSFHKRGVIGFES